MYVVYVIIPHYSLRNNHIQSAVNISYKIRQKVLGPRHVSGSQNIGNAVVPTISCHVSGKA